MPEIEKIDQECGKLLKELVYYYQNPTHCENPLNTDKFDEYLADHPNGKIEIRYIHEGQPIHLQNRNPTKLCKKTHNIVRSKR